VTALLLAAVAGAVLGATGRAVNARVRLLFAPHGGRHTAAYLSARITNPNPAEATP
jgi:hypothetical protein